MIDNYKIIKYPLSTEKSVRLMESDNIITLIVDKKAKKTQIRQAVEKIFEVKVAKVNVLISKGKKKAYVKLDEKTPAIDIATKLGLM